MKTTFRILTLCTFLFAGFGTMQAQVKLGHINVDELIGQMPEAKAAQASLEKYSQQLETELTEMEEEFANKYRNFEQNSKMMTELRREKEMQELQEMQMRMQDFSRKAQEDFEKKQRDLLQPIFEKAQTAIKEVATANGFTYIFDSSRSKGVLVFTEGGENVMALVKAKLGIE
jgi:outer membrane protein